MPEQDNRPKTLSEMSTAALQRKADRLFERATSAQGKRRAQLMRKFESVLVELDSREEAANERKKERPQRKSRGRESGLGMQD
jgi:hypothetical protein